MIDRTARAVFGCSHTAVAVAVAAVAVSNDGANLYAASAPSNAISAFARNRTTGAVQQLPGRYGCLVDRGGPRISRCQNGQRALNFAAEIATSLDGRNVYITSANAVAGFTRVRR